MTCFLNVLRRRIWLLNMCCTLKYITMCMVRVVVYVSGSVMFYDKRSMFWWSGLLLMVERCGWDGSSMNYGLLGA